MDVVFPRGEIVDNSMATDKQQHKAFLAFIWGQEDTCCSEMKWITKYLAVVEQHPGWPGVQKAQYLLLHCSGWCIWMYICVCVYPHTEDTHIFLSENVPPVIETSKYPKP